MIKYRFFGKDCLIDRELENRKNLNIKLNEEAFRNSGALFLNQIHGNKVVVIDDESKIHGEQNLPKADSLVTNLKNLTIGVITADCAPILFFDEEKEIIAATHAGWRGAKSGVIANTIAEMEKLGAKNIKAKIGPMIHQKSYEVSKEFFDDFLADNLANIKYFIDGKSADKKMFNLLAYVEEKIKEAGIVEVENLEIDTYEKEEEFFSYRRATHRGQRDSGRNVSVIEVS